MIRNRYNRPANEWFMREEDKRYWKMTQELVKRKIKKTAILTAISITVTTIFLSVLIFFRLRKYP